MKKYFDLKGPVTPKSHKHKHKENVGLSQSKAIMLHEVCMR